LSKLGIVAFSSTADHEMGDYDDEPTVIFRNGRFLRPSTEIAAFLVRAGKTRQTKHPWWGLI
jgi:hypothetical protein